MPKRIAVQLDLAAGAKPTPRQLHGLVSSWLGHRASTAQPWSLAAGKHAGDRPFRIEIGLLDDGLVAELRAALEVAAVEGVRLGPAHGRLVVSAFAVADETSAATWEEIAAGAGTSPARIALRFDTPTAFQRNDVSIPLPLPDLILGSYRRRWNEFAPPDLLDVSAATRASIRIARVRVESTSLSIWGTRVVGFTGDVLLDVMGEPEACSAVRALVALAPFAGTGVSTTAGMGVTSVRISTRRTG